MSSPPVKNAAHTLPRPLLEVRDLTVRFRRRGWRHAGASTRAAVQGFSLSLQRGEIAGLAGESGSGKSTLARAILGLVPADAGQVLLDGADMAAMNRNALREARRRIQIVFQDPASALSPRRTIGQTLLEPLEHFGVGQAGQRRHRIETALQDVGLDTSALPRYPHQFSSGQRQRIAIARALISGPDLLIADEAVASLDVSVQARILELLSALNRNHGIAILFIAHDLAVIRQIAQTVAVMYAGRLVEHAPAGAFFDHPRHPYTRQLLAAVAHPDPARPMRAPGVAAGLAPPPDAVGCAFRARCPRMMDICKTLDPPLQERAGRPGHRVECHLTESDEESPLNHDLPRHNDDP